MARYRVMAWRGIPAQVRAEDDHGARANREMPSWFAQEIDRAAMRDDLAGTDAYLEHWAWSAPAEMPGSADEVADAVVREQAATWGRPAGG
jgi:hypothetical protein